MSRRKQSSTPKAKRPGPAAMTSKNPVPATTLDPAIYKVPTPRRHRGPVSTGAIPGTGKVARRAPTRK